ncbi:prepilin-type N-terminal cleavage/methylation domain-containing protein [Candidatus Poribacteria bacterium]|nr:prepilin-type N-terminal cleavage/methylation domain-containing protein [Candidatus Poribacteria bacterium]
MKKENGFTLLEVLIAVSILAFVFTGLLQLNAFNLVSLNRSSTLTRLLFLTKQKMSEMEMSNFPELGSKSGELEDYPGYKWTENVSNFGIDGIHKVELTITAPSGEKNSIIIYKAR